jgi:hypothetical protein
MQELTEEVGATFVHGAVGANVTDARYDIAVEATSTDKLDKDWIARFDARLQERELVYRYYRGQGLIHAPRLWVMKSGWQKALVVHHTPKGGAANQVKLPIVYAEVPCPEFRLLTVGDAVSPSP